MDRKHGKYVVNIEHSERQTPITCLNGHEAHSSACWQSHSNDTTREICPTVLQDCMDSELPSQSVCQHVQPSCTQVKGNCCSSWSLWKVFLTCFLACLITTAIGVLIVCLVNSKANGNSSIIIQIPSNNGQSGTTSTTTKSTVTTTKTTIPTSKTPSTKPITTTSTKSASTAPNSSSGATPTTSSNEPTSSPGSTSAATSPSTAPASDEPSPTPSSPISTTSASTTSGQDKLYPLKVNRHPLPLHLD